MSADCSHSGTRSFEESPPWTHRPTEWEPQAAVLASASAHWLRHTAGSNMIDQQVDLRFVRDNFRHSSLSTTSGYLHSEEDARHQATQERHRIGWGTENSLADGLFRDHEILLARY